MTTSTARSITVEGTVVSGNVYYIHTDHLDTPREITNEQNQTVWKNPPLTEPFGSTPVDDDPDGDGQAFTFNLRFPGQYYDQETGAHYNYYRDNYLPDFGRYGQSDPIGLAGGINTYAYVKGNPLIYVDPEGLMEIRAHKLPSGDHKGEYRFTFTFSCNENCVRVNKALEIIVPQKWLKTLRRILTSHRFEAGLEDIEKYSDKISCAEYEEKLKELFLDGYGKDGSFGGDYLTEQEARDFMNDAKRILPPEIRDAYNWDNIIDTAKERSLSLR